ncbi:MAG: general secretion pathway protein GspK [Bradyrhizobium sp.]|jgi:general secretion pathway protein K
MSMGLGITFNLKKDNEGFIVVAVLWIVAALSALVLIYLTFVANTAITVSVNSDRVQTQALVTAGIELAAYQLTGFHEDVRPTSGTFEVGVGTGKVSVTFRSESARVDLNSAPKQLLAGLMAGLGFGQANASDFADRIVAWRTPTDAGDDDPENSFYRTSGVAYQPRHGPFPAAEELWLVKGIPPLVVETMLPFVTVFSNLGSINIRDAAPQVVAALPGMSSENLHSVLSQRGDPALDPRTLLQLAGAEGASLEASKAYRMTVAAELGPDRRGGAEVVILLLEKGNEPYRVLSWRNAREAGVGPQKASVR